MKNILVALFVLTCISGSNLYNQTNESGVMNGNNWVELGDDGTARIGKAFYLKGLFDGKILCLVNLVVTDALTVEGAKKISSGRFYYDVSDVNFSQLAGVIDTFYADPANRHIPVYAIAGVGRQRIKGELSEQDVLKRLQELRAIKWN